MGLPTTTSEENLVEQAVYQLEQVLAQQSAPMDTAAIFVEPVMGEGCVLF
jgi:4-aminobutyrate aminotransferase